MQHIRRYGLGFLIVLAVLFPFAFYSSELGGRQELSVVERIVRTISEPVQSVFSGGVTGVRHVVRGYIDLRTAKSEAQALIEENTRLKVQIQMFQQLGGENQRLRQILGLAEKWSLKFRSCEIVRGDPSFLYKNVRINCGEKDGVQAGMGVVAADGVVGVIMRSFDYNSDVLLITDPNSNIDVIVARNRRRGILSGNVANSMQFKYSDRGSRVQVGDEVMTSGLTGPFPGGLAVGRVSKIASDTDGVMQSMDVEPGVDILQISEVLVLLHPSREVENIRKIGGAEWMRKIVEGANSTRGG